MNETETMPAELVSEEEKQIGIVKNGPKEFFYYSDQPISFQGEQVDYFHFKKPTLKKAKAHNVVLGNDMPAKAMEALLRASLLRIAKKEGGEFLSCHFKEIVENLEMDEVSEMMNGCSDFFVKNAG